MKNGVMGREPNNNTLQTETVSTTKNHLLCSNNKEINFKDNASQSNTNVHPLTSRQSSICQIDATTAKLSNKDTTLQSQINSKDKLNGYPVITRKPNRFQIAAATTSSTALLDHNAERSEEPNYVNYTKNNLIVFPKKQLNKNNSTSSSSTCNGNDALKNQQQPSLLQTEIKLSPTTTLMNDPLPNLPRTDKQNEYVNHKLDKSFKDQQNDTPLYANYKQGMHTPEITLGNKCIGSPLPSKPSRLFKQGDSSGCTDYKQGVISTPESTATRKKHQTHTYVNLPPKSSPSENLSMINNKSNSVKDLNPVKYVDIYIPKNRKNTSSNSSQNDQQGSIKFSNGSLNRSRYYSKLSRSTEDTLNHKDLKSTDNKFQEAFKSNGTYSTVASLRSISMENSLNHDDSISNTNQDQEVRNTTSLRSVSSTSLRKTSMARLGNAFRELRRHTINSRRFERSQQHNSNPSQNKEEQRLQNGYNKNNKQQVSRSFSLPNIKNNVDKENRRNAKKKNTNSNSPFRTRGSVSEKQTNQNKSSPAILDFDSVDIISFPSERLNRYRTKSKDGIQKQANQNRSTPAILDFDSVDVISFPTEHLNGYKPKSKDGIFFTANRKNSSSANDCFTDNDDGYDEYDDRSMADKIRERKQRGRSRSVQLMASDTVRKNLVTRERSFSTDCDEHLFSFDKLVERRLNSSKETQLCETDL